VATARLEDARVTAGRAELALRALCAELPGSATLKRALLELERALHMLSEGAGRASLDALASALGELVVFLRQLSGSALSEQVA
jgi:hypothetical protein